MKTAFNILFFILVSLMVHPLFGQRLNGRVKSYKDCYFSASEKFGKVRRGAKLNDSIYRDKYVSLDQYGNVFEVIEYNYDGTIFCEYRGKCDYADNNFESMSVQFDPVKLIETKPFIIEYLKYPSGEMCEMAYINDATGMPVEETIFDLMGIELYKITTKRDELGRSLENKYSDGSVDKFKYDHDGNRIEWFCHLPSGNTIVTTYKHDNFGNMIEENINDSFKSAYKYHYEHNTCKYIFDKQDNWIERIEYEHDIPERILVRIIEYAK